MLTVYGCFCAIMAELSGYNRNYKKAKIFTIWPYTENACQCLV